MTKIVFIDTETTGLHPTRHEIWEVGAIVREEGRSDQEFEWQLPVDIGRASDEALELNGYWDRRWPANKIAPIPAFARVFSAMTKDAILVVNNPTFDIPRLDALIRPYASPRWHYHPRDVQDMAVGYLKALAREGADCDPGEPPWSGGQILRLFNIEPGDHTALGDARTVRDLWDRLT